MANPNSLNFYGEANEDEDEEEEQLEVPSQEKKAIDFASLLKGETAEDDSKAKSIGEIFGISKPEQEEDSQEDAEEETESSTINKEADQTSETDTASERTEPEPSLTAIETEAPEGSATRSAELDKLNDELVVANIREVPSEADSHIFSLAPEEQSELVAEGPSNNEKDSQQPGNEDLVVGRADMGRPDHLPPEAPDIPATAPEIKEPEAADHAEPVVEEAVSEASSETKPGPEMPSPEPEVVEPSASAENQPEPVVESEPEEPAVLNAEKQVAETEEASRNIEDIMKDEGPEDEQPPPRARRTAGGVEDPGDNPPAVSGVSPNEVLPEQRKESPVGMLALLLGVREIFKRRQGDKENKEELAKHEDEEYQRRQELKARQERIQQEMEHLKQAQHTHDHMAAPEGVNLPPNEETALNPHASVGLHSPAPDQNTHIYEREYDEAGQTPIVNETYTQAPEYETTELDRAMGSKLEADDKELSEQSRNLNQEIDGELALDSRQENTSDDNPPKGPAYMPDQAHQQAAAHISKVISEREYLTDTNPKPPETPSFREAIKPKAHSDELKSSIKAGVTTGLIIVVLAAIFLIFK